MTNRILAHENNSNLPFTTFPSDYFLETGFSARNINTTYKGDLSGTSVDNGGTIDFAVGKNFFNGHVQLMGVFSFDSNPNNKRSIEYSVHAKDGTSSIPIQALPYKRKPLSGGVLARFLYHYPKGTIVPPDAGAGVLFPLPLPNYFEIGVNYFTTVPEYDLGFGFYWDIGEKFYFIFGLKWAKLLTRDSKAYGPQGQVYHYSSSSRLTGLIFNLGYTLNTYLKSVNKRWKSLFIDILCIKL